ncbi:hypothetical protein Q1695_000151 [Nippostrongylus brasiliensis]|nr:hypothetical protein Q1695_000151 [Nippostrongylus brasiliensis]
MLWHRRHRRKKRLRNLPRRRPVFPHQFRVLLDSIKCQLKPFVGQPIREVFPILEALAGVVGKTAMLHAVRWQQAGLVRLVEAESPCPLRTRSERQCFEPKVNTESDGCQNSTSTAKETIADGKQFIELQFYEVAPMKSSYNPYYLLPNINYCTCKLFQNAVLKRKSRITCSHVLAVWLAQCLSTVTHVTMRNKTISLIAKHMASRSQEFF